VMHSTRVPKIVVVGSCITDMIAYSPGLPKVGQTVKGTAFRKGFGGKGANQAVMAARLGARVFMIGKVGNDVEGQETVRNFAASGVDASNVEFCDVVDGPTGIALICVDSHTGNNSIVIVSGANDLVTREDMKKHKSLLQTADFLVCQLEIPIEASLEAMRIAKEAGVKVLLNTAPASDALPDEVFSLCDIICPNETELEALTHKPVQTIEDATNAAKGLLARGTASVLVTLGSRGCLYVSSDEQLLCPVETVVKPVDATGAGDCFIGRCVWALVLCSMDSKVWWYFCRRD